MTALHHGWVQRLDDVSNFEATNSGGNLFLQTTIMRSLSSRPPGGKNGLPLAPCAHQKRLCRRMKPPRLPLSSRGDHFSTI